MSASLVGSEMCIRDSLPPSRRQRGPDEPCKSRRMLRSTDAQREPATRPVSYTHLTLPTICSV
eukprot:7751779-Alexandrium_andersonii.AAC.1